MLDEKLIASYRQTQYKIFTEHETIDVTIDYYSQSIESLLTATSSDSAAIVTAYNPYSQLRNEEENFLANKLLRNVLFKKNHRFLESLNIDPIQVWPTEKVFWCWILISIQQKT